MSLDHSSIPPPLPQKRSDQENAENTVATSQLDPAVFQVQAPDEVLSHKTQAITELAQSPELLRALYESTQQSETLYRQQKELAHKNIERARKLTQELHDLDIRRHEVQEKVNSVKEKERQWEETESEMYRAIQPWSLPALHSKLNHITSESEALSETLASSFLDSRGGAADPDTVAEFLREYRKARKAFHLRREWLARWNEERVRHA